MRFLLETITVEGAERVSAELLVSESLLTPGRSYSEAELALASYRIQRLPFILEARFGLRKGSRRDAYELVITVVETKRFFFGVDEQLVFFPDRVGLAGRDDRWKLSASDAAGYRQFLGPYGVAHAALHNDGGVELGYTHYNLFQRWVFASAAWSRNFTFTEELFPLGLDPTFSVWGMGDATRLSLAMGFPLGARQSLRLTLSELTGGPGLVEPVLQPDFLDVSHALRRQQGLRHQVAELRWIWDTTDDPSLPRRGAVATAGLYTSTLEAPLLLFSDPDAAPAHQTRLAAGVFSFHHTWPVGNRQAATLGARASLGKGEAETLVVNGGREPGDTYLSVEGRLEASHGLDLLSPERVRDWGDLRLESRLVLGREEIRDSTLAASLGRVELAVELVFRNPWGLFRIGLRWVDLER